MTNNIYKTVHKKLKTMQNETNPKPQSISGKQYVDLA